MLSAQEISRAKSLWIKESQRQNFESWKSKLVSSWTKLASGGVVEGYQMLTFPTQQNIRSCYLKDIT